MSTNLNQAFDVENGLTFSESGIAIFSGVEDPTTGAGIEAPVGSLFLRTTGISYLKSSQLATDWKRILRTGDIAGGVGVTDHSELTGLSNDDHLQYLPIAGGRSMAANLDMGNFSITNVTLVGGIDINNHGTRHNPNGPDPISTATAVNLSPASTSTSGIANSLARSDHTHAISGFQIEDPDLTAIAALSTTGIAVRTNTSTWATRSILGTTDQISVLNSAGVAGNITLSLSPNTILPGLQGVQLPSGASVDRNISPNNGTLRYNTTTGKTEVFQQGDWFELGTTILGKNNIAAFYTGPIPATSGTSTVPYDNTKPLSTEGSQILTATVTPTSVSSQFKFSFPLTVDCSTSNRVIIISVFRDSVNVGSAIWFATGGGRPNTMTLSAADSPGTSSPVTYSLRVGIGAGSGTWYVNSTSSGINLGGALSSNYEISEVI